ncbi:MAG: TIGR02281 family clan AA aspartic protease [Hyphomonadaceae bacterium]|jgi:aspartyl protease family protein|nr:TIGR02281 family clan AA aspartic protease [Hyphomonadaceae bacterium]
MTSLAESGSVRKALFPALALFGAAAVGLVALRDTVTPRVDAKPALAEEAEVYTDALPNISSHQIRTASLRKEGDGHYWATARVNDVPVKFLVDTGASLVALSKRDARRIGINTDNLQRNAEVRTAAGRVKAATTVIDEITIDGVTVKNVSAVIIEEGLEHSLLGMSFLNRLEGWDVTTNAIIIHE